MERLEQIIEDSAYLLDSLLLLRGIYKTGDCNNCGNKECQHKPKVGQMVRFNCYDYKPVYKNDIREVKDVGYKNDIREVKDVGYNANVYTKDEVIVILKALQEQIQFIVHEEKPIDKEWASGLRYSKRIIQQKIDELEEIEVRNETN